MGLESRLSSHCPFSHSSLALEGLTVCKVFTFSISNPSLSSPCLYPISSAKPSFLSWGLPSRCLWTITGSIIMEAILRSMGGWNRAPPHPHPHECFFHSIPKEVRLIIRSTGKVTAFKWQQPRSSISFVSLKADRKSEREKEMQVGENAVASLGANITKAPFV